MKDFNAWMNTKKTVNVHIMDGAEVLAEVKKAKVMISPALNSNKCPLHFKVFNDNTTINIGDRYINQIIKTGEYWSVFVDGYQHYLFS